MIVVSDTTPLRYLAVIGGLQWLPALFGEGVCPPEVLAECSHTHAPAPLRVWAASPPSWLRVMPVPEDAAALPAEVSLDLGETAALPDEMPEVVRRDSERGISFKPIKMSFWFFRFQIQILPAGRATSICVLAGPNSGSSCRRGSRDPRVGNQYSTG
ncbi:hypothetical protein BH20VER1_BH20VER1_00500 [soil metagenome]